VVSDAAKSDDGVSNLLAGGLRAKRRHHVGGESESGKPGEVSTGKVHWLFSLSVLEADRRPSNVHRRDRCRARTIAKRLSAAPGVLLSDSGEFTCDRKFSMFDGRGKDEAGDGISVWKERLNQRLKIGHGCGCDFEQKIVAAGEVMALAHLFKRVYIFEKAKIILTRTTHADEGKDLKAKSLAIDLDGVGLKDPDFFHLLEALGGCGRRKANAAA